MSVNDIRKKFVLKLKSRIGPCHLDQWQYTVNFRVEVVLCLQFRNADWNVAST